MHIYCRVYFNATREDIRYEEAKKKKMKFGE